MKLVALIVLATAFSPKTNAERARAYGQRQKAKAAPTTTPVIAAPPTLTRPIP